MNTISLATTTADVMLLAVAFNNEGVSLVEHGTYKEATESFANVLACLRPLIPGPGISSYMTDESTASTSCDAHHGASPVSSGPPESQQNDISPTDTNTYDKFQYTNPPPATPSPSCESHFIFRDPIEIPVDVIVRVAHPSTRLVMKFVVVAMYNLALASHLHALESNDSEILRQAQKLYEFAFQMHLDEACDVTLLFSLAVMNNLALIYHARGYEERSKSCFSKMLTAMMYLQESDEAKSIRQWEDLFSNVMDMMFKEQVVAASAA
jgi:hypothetical protein